MLRRILISRDFPLRDLWQQRQIVDEYNNGLTLCYDCIMFILGRKYPELDISKLKARVEAYMNEQNEKGKQ